MKDTEKIGMLVPAFVLLALTPSYSFIFHELIEEGRAVKEEKNCSLEDAYLHLLKSREEDLDWKRMELNLMKNSPKLSNKLSVNLRLRILYLRQEIKILSVLSGRGDFCSIEFRHIICDGIFYYD